MPRAPSTTANMVVVALLDGRRMKGWVYSFSTDSPDLNIFPDAPGAAHRRPAILVDFPACKAIFFVRSHEGSREGRDAERKAGANPRKRAPVGSKVRITFSDGEEMVACAESYSPRKKGFFVYPLDARSNNLRIYIVNANVRQVVTGDAFDRNATAAPGQERIARLAPPEPPGPPGAGAAPVSVELKCEAALRVLNGDAPADLSEEYGVPASILSFWTRSFLQAGRASLSSEGLVGETPVDTLVGEMQRRIRDLEAQVRALKEPPAAPRRPR